MGSDSTSIDSPRPTDTAGDAQAEVNHLREAKAEPLTPPPSAEKIRDRAAADVAVSSMNSTDHSHSEAPSPNQA